MADLIRFAERGVLILLSGGVVARILPQLADHPQMALFLISELVGVVLILMQRQGTSATAFYPVVIAFLGTGIGLLVIPTGQQLVSDAVSAAMIFLGAAIALAAKLSLRRSFGIVPANRGVKRGGVYRFIRHPMYAGYVINHVGFLLTFFSAWNVAIYMFAWLALWLRIIEEEKFLRLDPEYCAYAAQVRARLVPGVV